MKKLGLVIAFLPMLMLAGCQEYLPFSGGKLQGDLTPPPADWTEVASAEIIQLETNPADPYSVNLWVIGEPQWLYVFAGASRSEWVQHMDVDPNVRMKIGERIYELAAERVTDATEFERFAHAWETKYGNRPRNENVAETWLMKLRPR